MRLSVRPLHMGQVFVQDFMVGNKNTEYFRNSIFPKRNSFLWTTHVQELSFVKRRRKRCSGQNSKSLKDICCQKHQCAGQGISTPIPFQEQTNCYINFLGPADPRSNNVSVEPFSTSCFKVFKRICATTTEICIKKHSAHTFICNSICFLCPPTHCTNRTRYNGLILVARLSAIHFQSQSIRQVSCYTFLSGFQLP